MPSVDELERLSRYHANELSPDERAAVERELAARPDLREGLEVLKSLDGAAAALPPTLEGPALDELVAGVPRPAPRVSPARTRFVGAAVILLVGAGVVASFFKPSRPALALAWGDGVTLDGSSVQGRGLRSVADGARLKTATSGAQLLEPKGAAWLPPQAEVAWRDRGVELVAGTMMATGEGLELRAGQASAKIFGVAVASVEPAEGVDRVNGVLSTTTPEDLVNKNWLKLPSTLALASGLTLFVVEGHAEARVGESVVTVQAGQRWQPGSAPTAISAAPAAPVQKQPVVAATGGEAQLSREQLIAELNKVRDQNESLLRERELLKQKLDGKGKRNYYRLDPAEALELAKKNEIRVRGYVLDEEPFNLSEENAKSIGLSPAERAKVNGILQESGKRGREALVKFYVSMGGDANAASTFSSVALLTEIRTKALKDEYGDAIRQLANERAGLVPAGNPSEGPVVLRTFRMLVDEDNTVLDQLDAALGPARAEALVNDEHFPHSNHGFGVGPKNPEKK